MALAPSSGLKLKAKNNGRCCALVLTFGLREKINVASVRIEWPSGKIDRLTNVAGDQTITVEEGKGIILARQFSKHGMGPGGKRVVQRGRAATKNKTFRHRGT